MTVRLGQNSKIYDFQCNICVLLQSKTLFLVIKTRSFIHKSVSFDVYLNGRSVPFLGPISSTSLRRVFVLKTSYEVRTLKIGFHQTIELCKLLTFCGIFKTTI